MQGIDRIVALTFIVLWIAGCANDEHLIICHFQPDDSSGRSITSTEFTDVLLVEHKPGENIGTLGHGQWQNYFYDPKLADIYTAGRLDDPTKGYVRFFPKSHRLVINLPPRTLLSYRCKVEGSEIV